MLMLLLGSLGGDANWMMQMQGEGRCCGCGDGDGNATGYSQDGEGGTTDQHDYYYIMLGYIELVD